MNIFEICLPRGTTKDRGNVKVFFVKVFILLMIFLGSLQAGKIIAKSFQTELQN